MDGIDQPSEAIEEIEKDLNTATVNYRTAMAGFLKTSLGYMIQIAGEETTFPGLDAAREELDRDPRRVVELHGVLLVRKARLHVVAALEANRDGNLHSLAVQMRPALECAGQVVSVFHKLFIEPDPSAVDQYRSADFLQTMQHSTRGQMEREDLLRLISEAAPPEAPPASRRRPKRLFQSDKVESLEGGRGWYGHLSDFHHPTLHMLRGPSLFGGVGSNNAPRDLYAFGLLMDYLAHQMLVMVAHAALSPTTDLESNPLISSVFSSLHEKRAATRRHYDHMASLLPSSTLRD